MDYIYFLDIFSQGFEALIDFELVIHIFIIVLTLVLDDILAFRRHSKEFTLLDSVLAVVIAICLAVFTILPISLTPLSCTINLVGAGLLISVFMRTFMSLVTKYRYTYKDIRFMMQYAPHYRRKYRHNKRVALFIVLFFIVTNIYLVLHLLRIIYIIEHYNI